MHWLEIVLIGIALSMDALAVSVVLGAAEGKNLNWKRILVVALFFGSFQAFMFLSMVFPVSSTVESEDPFAAFAAPCAAADPLVPLTAPLPPAPPAAAADPPPASTAPPITAA